MSLGEKEREREHDEHGGLTQRDRSLTRSDERVVDPPPSTPEDDGLALHRIALRACVRGATAGLCVTIVAILIFAVGNDGPTLTKPIAWLLMWVGSATGCALLVGADEVSRHAPPRLRLPTAALVGALTTAIMAAAVVWLGAIVDGKGANGGWFALTRFFDDVFRRPKESLPGAGGLLVVFLALWLSRTIRPGLAGVLLRSLVGAGAGLLSFLLLCAVWGFPSGNSAVFPIVVFTAVPAAAVPGLSLGGLVEERLLAWFARWRAAGDGG